jgi:hypothetical protein
VTEFFRRHRALVLSVLIAGLALLVFVLVWFQPQKLVIESKVNEAAPTTGTSTTTAPDADEPVQGSFTTLEHETKGRAVVIDTGEARVLRFEDFETSNGPDLVVYLSASHPKDLRDQSVAKDFVDLGQLKGNIGAQNYEIPPGTDLDRYSSVVIWCRRFNVSFGAAKLA